MATERQEPSGLLALPPELRNRIYSYVLPGKHVPRFCFTARVHLPPLLHVSHQISREALGLFFSSTQFQVVVYEEFGLRKVMDWITSLPAEARKALMRNRHLTIRVIFDWRHGEYEAFEHQLGTWAVAMKQASWWIIAGSHKRHITDASLVRARERELERV